LFHLLQKMRPPGFFRCGQQFGTPKCIAVPQWRIAPEIGTELVRKSCFGLSYGGKSPAPKSARCQPPGGRFEKRQTDKKSELTVLTQNARRMLYRNNLLGTKRLIVGKN